MNPYAELGLDRDASKEDRRAPPDACGDPQALHTPYAVTDLDNWLVSVLSMSSTLR